MRRVLVVNEPTGARGTERRIDLTPALQYGELIFLTPAGQPPADLGPLIGNLAQQLSGFDAEQDSILPVGHPALIGAVYALLGLSGHRHIRTLVWVRRLSAYRPVMLELPAPAATTVTTGCRHGYPSPDDCPICSKR